MKKITALILSVCAIFSLLACAQVDNAQENGDSSSLADSSILEDAPIIDGYTPDYPVVEYPDYVIETEGENKYQSYKMQAPSKNASVTEYQNYALQQIDANIINPKIVGDSVKISPLLVIFAVTIGGAYFGVMGMFLGVPVAALIKLIMDDIIERNYAKKKDLATSENTVREIEKKEEFDNEE